MRIAFEGYERDRHVRWMKVYRAKISVNGVTRVSRRPFRRATTAEAYAVRWAERAQRMADHLFDAATLEVEPALQVEVEVGA